MNKRKILEVPFSFLSATRYHINGGMLLIITALLAMIIANSPWASAYFDFWQHDIRLQIGTFNLFNHHGSPLTLIGFINDALMAIFFFSVGLEIKREILVGELSSVKQALLPIIAAIGGMIVPVLIYFFMTQGTPAERGLAIPMATDIAFSLGVLGLFGKHIPLSLKIFLTAFAVVDDIGGILIIALFYSNQLSITYLLISLIVLAILLFGNYLSIRRRWFYLWLGLLMWYLFMQSGIHATIAGVIVAFTIPATPHERIGKYIRRIKENISSFPFNQHGGNLLNKEQISRLKSIESASDRVISPLQSLEDDLHAMVNYIIMPVFAFANAGVSLYNADGNLELGQTTLAVLCGLVVGKVIGIYLFTILAVRFKLSAMPTGMNKKNLLGISLLGGIGFTVSLFIANLSFGEDLVQLNQAKMGVVIGTFLAGIGGSIALKWSLRRH